MDSKLLKRKHIHCSKYDDIWYYLKDKRRVATREIVTRARESLYVNVHLYYTSYNDIEKNQKNKIFKVDNWRSRTAESPFLIYESKLLCWRSEGPRTRRQIIF